MEFWHVFGLAAAVSIPGSVILWVVTGFLARHIVRKRHEEGRQQGKTDEEISKDYLIKNSIRFPWVWLFILIVGIVIVTILLVKGVIR